MLTRLLRTRLRPYVRRVAIIVVLLLVTSIANLFLPNLTADIINNGVVKGDIGYIWRTGAVMLAITLALSVVFVTAVYFSAGVAMSVGRDLREAIFSQVQGFSAQEMNRFGAPSLITRNTNDVQQVQMFLVIGLTVLVSAPITAVGGVVMALYEDRTLSLLLIVVVPLMAALIGGLLLLAVPLFRAMQVKIDRINQVLRDQITGVRVTRAFVRGEHERARFAEVNGALTAIALRVTRLFSVAQPGVMIILQLSSVAVIWFGGHLAASGSMPIGNLTAFLAYLLQVLMAVLMAAMMTILIPRASACAERIVEVVSTEPAIKEPDRPVPPSERRGVVEFRDVTFSYPGAERAVLRHVTFTLRPGATTAIIGSTGSGKTTIVNLVTRFFDATDGSVMVDGVDVREQSLQGLRDTTGLVPQQSYLFGGTVASNLRLGRPEATDDELWQALEVAQASEFVAAMSSGLDEPIAQGGTNVSGGQRQRLAIARALVKRPGVYLFDDCFSALDAATDARLRSALKASTAESTVLIVSQRVSTIRDADQIIVVDDGAVVGVGTHDELLGQCPTYREIVDSQLRGAEQVA